MTWARLGLQGRNKAAVGGHWCFFARHLDLQAGLNSVFEDVRC